jgi:hypothetical protein
MTDAPQAVPETEPTVPAVRDYRSPLTMGLAIGMAFAVARGMQTNLEPMIGYWGALAASTAAAGAVGGLAAVIVLWVLKPRKAKPD